AGGAVPLGSAWVSTSVGLLAVAIAALSRWVPWRRARRPVVEFLAFLFALGAVAAAVLVADRPLLASPWPLIATLAAGVAVALTMRWPLLHVVRWVSWAQSLALAVLLIERAGLPHRWLDVAGGACGAALVLGVCSVDRARHGRADWRQGFRSVSLRAPGVLGAAAFVAGGFVGASGESGQVVGWLALAAAAVMLALALLRPLGLLSFATHTLSTMALCLLVPWGPFRHPWSLVLWAAALLGVAWLVRSPKEAPPATRWDLPAFVVAHGALLAALMGTVPHGSVAVTFGLASAVLFTVALVTSLPLWAVAAAMLALVAAADVGMGMLALALLVEGVLVTAVALLRPSRWRVQMLAVGALLCGAAWLAFIDWLSWSTVTVLVVTAPLAAAIALAACTGIRVKRLPFDLLAVWAALGAGGSVAASALLPRITETHRLAGGVAVAASLAALGLAAGLVADRLGGALRWVAAAGWSASLSALIWALDLSPAWVAVLGSVLGFCVCLGLLVLQAKRPLSPWVRPAVVVALCSQAWAVAALGFEPSNRVGVTMLVLMLLAAEVAAAAVFLGRHELLLASPVLACAAWFVFVRSALDAAPLWFTVPAGVTLLVDVGIIRWILRERRGAATSIGIAVLEYVGMAFVVGGFMVRTLGGELVFGLLAIVAGVALLGWGAATKVRRRAGFGAGSVVVAALLMVGVPLTAVITTWRGPMLWLAVAGLGALAILVAALVEQGRRTARRLIEALEEATLDWERTGGPDVWRTTHPKPGA
ncbi:MAG: hypothetical protein KGR47_10770, partial [Acidobacteria bacterium]|nr:hypothetical protein [Acidobacteriota bacterium]